MKTRFKIPFPLMIVEWKDHVSDAGGWTDAHNVVSKPAMCLTVGWMVKEDAEGLTLVAALDPDDPKSGQMGGTQYILKNCVTKAVVLRKGYEKKAPTSRVRPMAGPLEQ